MLKELSLFYGAKKGKNNYKREVKRLVIEIFGSNRDDDYVWDQWLNLEKERTGGIRGFLASDVRDTFKARVIAISLAPENGFMPFTWYEKYISLWDNITLSDFSSELQGFVFKLIRLSVDEVSNSGDEDLRKTLSFYNKIILQGLALLPEDDPMAKELFSRYHLPIPFWNMEDSSGYNPFLSILRASVPEKWKRLADEKMREIIRLEEKGCLSPRSEWEKALKRYVEHIQLGSCTGRLTYDTDLFASQIEFIIGFDVPENKISFNRWHVRAILTLLRDEKYVNLRHEFARYAIIRNDFEIICEPTYLAATLILEEFGNKDQELRKRLIQIINKGKERLEKEREITRTKEKEFHSIMQKMK